MGSRRAGLVLVGSVLLAAGCGSGSGHRTAVTAPSTTTVTSTTTVPAKTTTTSTTAAPGPTTTSTSAPPATIKGTVSGPTGQPVPNALIIDSTSLQVLHADGQGRFVIPYCAPLDQLWISTWVIPLGTTYPTSFGKPGSAGGSTTYFTTPPTTPGPGYARLDRIWSGAAADATPCQGQQVGARMPAGGTVDITWLRKSATGSPTPVTGPVSGYYEILPGLPYNSGTYVPQADSTGHQVMAQLGAGGLAVNSNSVVFTCTGAAVHRTSGSSWEVTVVAGQTDQVTCTV